MALSVVLLLIAKKKPSVIKKCYFLPFINEQGHKKIVDYLGVRSLLQLDLRLGEGTGCAIFPIIESAVAFLNEMASFESAGVSGR
jgi:nicotinate-nucleotide--dimethylbenzimidazole phosphoribosyltransferase